MASMPASAWRRDVFDKRGLFGCFGKEKIALFEGMNFPVDGLNGEMKAAKPS
jgi:hypothetical protein